MKDGGRKSTRKMGAPLVYCDCTEPPLFSPPNEALSNNYSTVLSTGTVLHLAYAVSLLLFVSFFVVYLYCGYKSFIMLLLSSARNILATAQASVIICAAIYADPNLSSASDAVPENMANNKNPATNTARLLRSCSPNSNCVSSNYKEPPNRYISPLMIVNDRDMAFQRAIRDLKQHQGDDMWIVEIVPKDYYIHLTVPGTAPASLDDLELIFKDDIVNVKCEARVTLPPPPFCVKKNCINGNMDQRSRVENLAFDVLGLPASDREQMKGAKWTPIFLNSDRVPGFDDEF